MSAPVTGGCLCGDVRFSISGDPVVQLFCYCKDCLRASGTDGFAAYVVPRPTLTLDQGEISSYTVTAASGRANTRNFCGKCGSRLWADLEMGVASVAAGSLDDPSIFKPSMTHCVADGPSWARVDTALEEMPVG